MGALNQFKAGECNILICNDAASRGLDIPSVDIVINYDIPSNSKVRFCLYNGLCFHRFLVYCLAELGIVGCVFS